MNTFVPRNGKFILPPACKDEKHNVPYIIKYNN